MRFYEQPTALYGAVLLLLVSCGHEERSNATPVQAQATPEVASVPMREVFEGFFEDNLELEISGSRFLLRGYRGSSDARTSVYEVRGFVDERSKLLVVTDGWGSEEEHEMEFIRAADEIRILGLPTAHRGAWATLERAKADEADRK